MRHSFGRLPILSGGGVKKSYLLFKKNRLKYKSEKWSKRRKDMSIKISEPRLVYAPQMNEAISKWGVYAIPRMWREPSGELVVRFNGEEDSSDVKNMQRAPNLYFSSSDNG